MSKTNVMRKNVLFILLFTVILACSSNENKKSSEENNVPQKVENDTLIQEKVETFVLDSACRSNNSALIALKVSNLEKSKQFYTDLGWIPLPQLRSSDKVVMWDGSSLLLLDTRQEEKLKYVYHLSNSLFQQYFDSIQPEEFLDDYFSSQLPDSLTVEFIQSDLEFPCTENMQVVLETGDYMNLPMHNKVLGCYAELAMNYNKVEEAIIETNRLGFKNNGLQTQPYKWVAMSDGLALLSYHNTKEWHGMNITYFGKENDEKAEKLKEKGIEMEPVKMGDQVLPGNYIISDPDGNKIFMFQLF